MRIRTRIITVSAFIILLAMFINPLSAFFGNSEGKATEWGSSSTPPVQTSTYAEVSLTATVVAPPRLWIWRHGAKVWPEWQVGYYNETQVLYARIVNDGNQSVYVKVEFIIYGPVGPESVESNILLCNGIPPGNVTVSAEYHPIPGTFHFQAILYYSFDTINWKPWSEVQDILGGEGVSKTASSKFKVRT